MSGWPFSKREVYPTDAELAEYLARLREGYDQDIMGKKKVSTLCFPSIYLCTRTINKIFRPGVQTQEIWKIWKQIR